MKFYNSLGPNPRLVRMFLLEKGIELPTEEVDIMGGQNRGAEYVAKNPSGQMPALELDDGSTPEERATTRMWTRRVEQKITVPSADGFRYAEGLAMFKDRMRTIPQAADDLKALAKEGFEWLDAQIGGREWIAGDSFTLADIVLYCFADFGPGVGQPFPAELSNVNAWFQRVAARPSAEASIHPAAKAGGMRA